MDLWNCWRPIRWSKFNSFVGDNFYLGHVTRGGGVGFDVLVDWWRTCMLFSSSSSDCYELYFLMAWIWRIGAKTEFNGVKIVPRLFFVKVKVRLIFCFGVIRKAGSRLFGVETPMLFVFLMVSQKYCCTCKLNVFNVFFLSKNISVWYMILGKVPPCWPL